MKRTATVSESESAMFLNTAMSQQTLNTSAGHCRLYSFKSSWNPLSHYKRVNQAEGPWPLTTLHSFMCPTKKLDTHTVTDYSTNCKAKSLEKSCKKLELGNSLKPSLCSPACIYKMHFYSHAFQVLSQASGTVLCYNKELLLILKMTRIINTKKKAHQNYPSPDLLSTLISTNFRLWLMFLYVFTESWCPVERFSADGAKIFGFS